MDCNKPLLKQKQKHKKGLWSPEEDFRLRNYVVKHGHGCWSSVPINAGLKRTGKSCRLRWMNYLRPGLKRGMLTEEEEHVILALHAVLGNKWSQIAQHLPGRTDNEIKNYWHSYLKKRMPQTEQNQTQNTPENTSPNATSTEPTFSLHSQESIVRYPSFNSYDNIDRSSMSTKQETILPRVLFAEWLSLDQFQGHGLSTSIGARASEVPKDVESKQDCEDSFLNDFLLNEGAFCCGFLSDDDDDVSNHFDHR